MADVIADENIPPSLKAEARDIIGTIATTRAGGNQQAAEEHARAAAQSFGRKLARSAWKGNPEDDFDPRAIANQISRARS